MCMFMVSGWLLFMCLIVFFCSICSRLVCVFNGRFLILFSSIVLLLVVLNRLSCCVVVFVKVLCLCLNSFDCIKVVGMVL